ncbi:hypothetical protein PIB30_057388 [Stylosanthes scabra]|uniref:Uncharacterized protein n=1 Tax=Stylosanthes scabra TaxID=79078 RepID=A0ABU6TLR0_9FABA|nr:hypothetical protein [Stylosanthes scabra]
MGCVSSKKSCVGDPSALSAVSRRARDPRNTSNLILGKAKSCRVTGVAVRETKSNVAIRFKVIAANFGHGLQTHLSTRNFPSPAVMGTSGADDHFCTRLEKWRCIVKLKREATCPYQQ